MKVVAIGKNSFLGQSLLAASRENAQEGVELHSMDWRRLDAACLESADIVVNFAIDPRYRKEPYDVDFDTDLKVAGMIPNSCRYVMLSSRKVYDPDSGFELSEESPLGPVDRYGTNKWKSELALKELLDDRLVILRVANIVGNELHAPRVSFMKLLQTELVKNNRIILDVSPEARRDFLPADWFGSILWKLIGSKMSGAINVGSGTALTLGQICNSVIVGFGSGHIEVTNSDVRDEFVLNVDKLLSHGCSVPSGAQIQEWCVTLGNQLANESI